MTDKEVLDRAVREFIKYAPETANQALEDWHFSGWYLTPAQARSFDLVCNAYRRFLQEKQG